MATETHRARPRVRRGWRQDRFTQGEDPLTAMSSLVDLMLVFACGLMAALAAATGALDRLQIDTVKRGRELERLPPGIERGAAAGYEPMGRVFRDPVSGKLILVGE